MANSVELSTAIENFRNAIYGEEVRGSLIEIAEAVQAAINGQVIEIGDIFNDPQSGTAADARQVSRYVLFHRDVIDFDEVNPLGVDLNDYTDIGIWLIRNAAASHSGYVLHLPDDVTTGGHLVVIRRPGYSMAIQLYVSTGNTVHLRLKTSESGDWSVWRKIGTDQNSVIYRGSLSAEDDLDSFTEPGMWIKTTGILPTNWPEDLPNAARLIVFSHANSTTTPVQVIFSGTGIQCWYRYKGAATESTTGWSAWRQVVTDRDLDAAVKDLFSYRGALAPEYQEGTAILRTPIDFDDYVTNGTWRVKSNAVLTGGRHAPLAGTGGVLTVFRSASDGIVQKFTSQRNQEWTRYRRSGVWTPWRKSSMIFGKDPYESGKGRAWATAVQEVWQVVANGMTKTYGSNYGVPYPVGEARRGLNYSSALYCGGDVFYNRSLATYFSALENPASCMYTKKAGANYSRSSFYGAVCSTFVSWLLGQPIYWATSEFKDLLTWKAGTNITGVPAMTDIEELEPGDVFWYQSSDTSGHVALIVDVYSTADGEYIKQLEAGRPRAYYRDFEADAYIARCIERGTPTEKNPDRSSGFGYLPGTHIRSASEIDMDWCSAIIPDMGDKTWYLLGDTVELYIPGKGESDPVHYRLKGTTNWTHVYNLESKTVNGATVWDFTGVLTEAGTYQLALSLDSEGNAAECAEITMVDPGSATLDGPVDENPGLITWVSPEMLPGTEPKVRPVWWQAMYIYDDGSEVDEYYYTAELNGTVYSANWVHGEKDLYYTDPTATQNRIDLDTKYLGMYARVWLDTGVGLCWVDTPVVYLGGSYPDAPKDEEDTDTGETDPLPEDEG